MKSTIVRYKTLPERAEENQRLVEGVFAELAQRDPGGVRYASYRLADGVSFVHVVSVETDDGLNPVTQLAAFAAFTRDIGARCAEPPTVQDATVVGAYRIHGD